MEPNESLPKPLEFSNWIRLSAVMISVIDLVRLSIEGLASAEYIALLDAIDAYYRLGVPEEVETESPVWLIELAALKLTVLHPNENSRFANIDKLVAKLVRELCEAEFHKDGDYYSRAVRFAASVVSEISASKCLPSEFIVNKQVEFWCLIMDKLDSELEILGNRPNSLALQQTSEYVNLQIKRLAKDEERWDGLSWKDISETSRLEENFY